MLLHGILKTLIYSKGNGMRDEEVCDKCKFYHTYGASDREGTCRRHAPICSGVSGYHDTPSWPKVFGNSMWCGEFKSKDSKEVTP